jgi:SAM-dependent methyltransferase
VPQSLSRALRQGLEVDDHAFDLVFPSAQRFRSWLHWTPLEVAQRACALLAPEAGDRILDVGSGVGKPCLVGALTTEASWFGIERDGEMVRAANEAALKLGVERQASFHAGEMEHVDWSAFDAFYLFNPFAEILYGPDDDALERRMQYVSCIETVQYRLAQAAPGTRVVTYHGFGGDMPPELELVQREAKRDGDLCLWIHRGAPRRRG